MSIPSKIPDPSSRDHPWRHIPGAIGSRVDAAIRGIAGDIQSVLRGNRQVVRPDAILQPHLLSPTARSVLNGPPITRSEVAAIKLHLEKVLANVETSLQDHQSAFFQSYQHAVVHQMVELAEANATDLKYALDFGVFAEKVSEESATELKLLVDRLVLAIKDSRFLRLGRVNMSVTNLRGLRQVPTHASSLCGKAFKFVGFVEGIFLAKDIFFPDKNNGPGLFRDIGKKAKALLHDDYLTGYDVTLNSEPSERLFVIPSLRLINQDVIGRVLVQFQHLNFSLDMNALVNSNVVTKFGLEDLDGSGCKGTVSLPMPWNNTSKLEIEAHSPFAGLTGSIGLYVNPRIDFSGLWGTKLFSGGFHCELNTATSEMTRAIVGLSARKDHSAYGLTLNRSGLLTGTVWKEVVPIRFNFPASMKGFEKYANPIINLLDPVINYLSPGVITTQVGGMFDYCFSTNRARVMIGLEHQLDDATTLKGRLSSAGWATALVNRRIGEKAVVTISSEVNLNDIQGPPRIGIRLSLP